MYYPKSEITPNLYTSGNRFTLLSTGKYYSGYYFSTSDGKYFTGAEYSPDSEELSDVSITTKTIDTFSDHYFAQPTDNDYKNGFFVRYAIKRVNSGVDTIKEIKNADLPNIKKNPLYISVSFKWKISGPLYDDLSDKNYPLYGIIDTNKRTLSGLEKQLPGISKFFFDLAQFSQ